MCRDESSYANSCVVSWRTVCPNDPRYENSPETENLGGYRTYFQGEFQTINALGRTGERRVISLQPKCTDLSPCPKGMIKMNEWRLKAQMIRLFRLRAEGDIPLKGLRTTKRVQEASRGRLTNTIIIPMSNNKSFQTQKMLTALPSWLPISVAVLRKNFPRSLHRNTTSTSFSPANGKPLRSKLV